MLYKSLEDKGIRFYITEHIAKINERPEACKLKGKEEMILQYIKEHKTKVYISKKLGVNRQTLREFLKTHPEIPRKWKRIQKD